MRLTSLLFVAVAGLFLSAGSCVETDIGADCVLQKDRRDPNLPGCADVKDGEESSRPECFHPTVADLAAGQDKDYVSFGAAECENLTCVRSAGEPVPESEGAPNGYCSGECITNADCESDTGDFECRSLVLDQSFLDALRENLTQEEWDRYFGRIQQSKFCARKG